MRKRQRDADELGGKEYGGGWSGPLFALTIGAGPAHTFLTGAIGQAVATARSAAGGKNLEILGADVVGQCLRRGSSASTARWTGWADDRSGGPTPGSEPTGPTQARSPPALAPQPLRATVSPWHPTAKASMELRNGFACHDVLQYLWRNP